MYLRASVLTGSWYWDIAIFLFFFFFWWVGAFRWMKPEQKEFTGGFFIYRDYVGNTRNLGHYFNLMKPDLLDYLDLNPHWLEHPFAAIFHGDTNMLCTTNDQRASIGFFVRVLDSKISEYFKKEGYKVAQLPATKCLYVDFPYRFCSPLVYMFSSQKSYGSIWRYQVNH